MSCGARNSITSPSAPINTKHKHIPCKLYQDLLNIKTHYCRILEDINLSKNDDCFTKDHIQKSAQKLSKSQLVDHLSDILCSLRAISLDEYCSDNNYIPEEYKRIRTEAIEEVVSELFNSPSFYNYCSDELSTSANNITEYNIMKTEEPDKISDMPEGQTNIDTQTSRSTEVEECYSDLIQYDADECIHEEFRHKEKRIKTEPVDEDTKPVLLDSQSCYKYDETSTTGNDEKFSFGISPSDIFEEYYIEEPDEIPDTLEGKTNTETQSSLSGEIKECRSDLIQCKKCSFTATLPSSMKLHEAVHNRKQGELLCCSICDFQTNKSSNFNNHIFVHTAEKLFKCYHCDKHYSYSGSLSNHLKTEHPHLILKCEKCDFHVFTAAAMKKHIELLHPETEREFISCEKCKFTATKSLTIILHQATHTKKKYEPFKCPECDYATSHITRFNGHISVHTGDRRCVCKYCNAAFFSTNTLVKHVRSVHHM